MPVFVLNIPFPSSVNFDFNSFIHSGCVKSPVPNKFNPFTLAHFSKLSISSCLEVALEYFECKCKSAIIFI